MTHHPLSRYAASPWTVDDALCCGVALVERSAGSAAPVSRTSAHAQPSGERV